MPLYSLDIEKLFEGEYWTNRYVLNASDLPTANGMAPIIYDAERSVHRDFVLFTKYRVSDFNPATDAYFITQTNAMGLLGGANPSQCIPLFNVVRVDFTTFGGGRPSRKYLRLPLAQPEIQGNKLVQTTIDRVLLNYVGGVLSQAGYVDVDQQAFTQATVYPFVGMRQLRRGTKRKLAPIIT